ncbi:DUF1800 domain-containing protein [Sphingomonas sp. TDK1]|uniref:DUF1800 domain-containing protein n=1 Tax=Sphingomonas sp. TDK1 TaxID=453247 RepID=UPI0007D8FB2C|nr:DUF1800 family protein [Sphingomonas sp. TDK1]OAN62252.1 hypothetical protein A7X12_22440 [Sphingomonas sp. TDK1]
MALAILAACDGGGGAGSGTSAGGLVSAPPQPTQTPAGAALDDSVRLAQQASFGPNMALVERIRALGVNGWLDEQFAASGSTYADLATDVRANFCASGDNACSALHFSRTPVAMRFYADAISAPDQLRQRVAFALSQMIVASEAGVRATAGIAAFNQLFLTYAFGSYRDLLLAVTMSGYMGDYLDMADSRKGTPSENYAREFLQLFTMGPDKLQMDGSIQRDASGGPIPNYTSDEIREVARALTGWTYARVDNAAISDSQAIAYAQPMIAVPSRYDSAEKRFLGTVVAAGTSQQASVAAVVDAAFNHPSTPPFVARHLITHLVTPNPSPAYIGRVAAVFVNNGSGVRGDMKAVVRALLTDAEARAPQGSTAGKLKEPALAMTSLARAIGFTTDGYVFQQRDTGLAQPVMRAPSVFNFYPDDFPLPGSATLRSPASKLMTAPNQLRLHNLVYDWTVSGDATRSEYAAVATVPGSSGSAPVWADWEALADNVDGMVDRVNLLMFANGLTKAQRDALKAAGVAVTNADPKLQARKRAQMMLYIAGTSPMFLVDR